VNTKGRIRTFDVRLDQELKLLSGELFDSLVRFHERRWRDPKHIQDGIVLQLRTNFFGRWALHFNTIFVYVGTTRVRERRNRAMFVVVDKPRILEVLPFRTLRCGLAYLFQPNFLPLALSVADCKRMMVWKGKKKMI